ncbi:MAG: hypothetical protein K2K55_03635, partial [Duncaniella sp.]|nr:hypothetical protein [Duncaniella sp.]
MKEKTPKATMIISAAAAARLFLKIATMAIRPDLKDRLMKTVSSIISGQSDIADADFSDDEAKQIGTELEKAIRRSSTARAAAARRRASASPVVTEVEEQSVAGQTVGMEEFSAITSEPSDVREEVE